MTDMPLTPAVDSATPQDPMRRYILQATGILLLLLVLALCLSYIGMGACVGSDRNACGLYRHQLQKIAAATDIDTAFFGDSSAGNAIDAAHFSTLLGRPAMNFALNGTMGLPMAYLQMQNLFARVPVRHAVIFLSDESYRHHFEHGAEYFAAAGKDEPGIIFGLSPRTSLDVGIAYVTMLFDADVLHAGFNRLVLGRDDHGECRGCDLRDYIQQSDSKKALDSGDLNKWNGPYKDYAPFLHKIARLCAQYQVDCRYMHGPMLQQALDKNPDYAAHVDDMVTKAGLALADPQPIVIPPDEIGDALNHVRPDLRPLYTERIYGVLKPWLNQAGAAAQP
jgi:hypothetical protein